MITALATATETADTRTGFIAVGLVIVLTVLYAYRTKGLVALVVGTGGLLLLGNSRTPSPLTEQQQYGLAFIGLLVGAAFSFATFSSGRES